MLSCFVMCRIRFNHAVLAVFVVNMKLNRGKRDVDRHTGFC